MSDGLVMNIFHTIVSIFNTCPDLEIYSIECHTFPYYVIHPLHRLQTETPKVPYLVLSSFLCISSPLGPFVRLNFTFMQMTQESNCRLVRVSEGD